MQISGKVFLITGAPSGLGEATARRFVTRVAKAVLADVNPAGGALATELGASAHFIPTDVTRSRLLPTAARRCVSLKEVQTPLAGEERWPSG